MCSTSEKKQSKTTVVMARRNNEGKITCDNTKMIKNRSNTSKSNSPIQESSKNRMNSPEHKEQVSRTLQLSTSPPRPYSFSPVSKPGSPTEKQYAGCKWTEPPSPSTLPQPPKHWMQSSQIFKMPFKKCQPDQDFAQQLKVLLKVQA